LLGNIAPGAQPLARRDDQRGAAKAWLARKGRCIVHRAGRIDQVPLARQRLCDYVRCL